MVTDADRQAAISCCECALRNLPSWQDLDFDEMVRQFAKHREAGAQAEPASVAFRIAGSPVGFHSRQHSKNRAAD